MKKKILAVLAAAVIVGIAVFLVFGRNSGFDGTPVDYANLELEEPELIEVTDEDIELGLESLLNSNMLTTEITDRAIETGDIVNIDFTGYLDGEAFEGGSSDGAGYDLTIGSGASIDGFEDGLIGVESGETVSLDLTFPEDYGSDELNGQAVVFEVTVNYISVEMLPELTDEFIQEVSDTCTTVEEYEAELRATYEAENLETQDYSKESLIWTAIIEGTEVNSYPEEEINATVDYFNEMYEYQASYYSMTLEEFIEASGMTSEEYDEYVLEAAQQSYVSDMIIQYIGEQEGLIPSDEEYQEEIDSIVTMYGYEDEDTFLEYMGMTREEVELEILLEIVLDWLVENVTFVPAA